MKKLMEEIQILLNETWSPTLENEVKILIKKYIKSKRV